MKKLFVELIAKMEKTETFEKNVYISYISNLSTFLPNNMDGLLSSSDSDSPVISLWMPIPISYL